MMTSHHVPEHQVAAVARFAAQRCARWGELLADWIALEGTPRELPIIDRADLFGSALQSPRALVVDGRLEHLTHLLLSSGSSGGPRAWTGATAASGVADDARLSRALASIWGLESGSVLVLNLLPAGPSLDLPGTLVVHTGPEPELVCELLGRWASEFDTTMIVGEPWAVKAALERAQQIQGTELAALDLRVAVGGELLPESLRDYLAGLIGADLDHGGARILASMGCSEVGLQLAWETPSTVALRRALVHQPKARAQVCGVELPSAPCIMTWDPDSIFVEFVDGQLVLTCLDLERAVPLIRYRLGDRGGFIVDRAQADRLVAARRPDLSLPERLLFISGRDPGARLAALAEAVAACHDALPQLTGGFYLELEGDAFVIQLVDDEAPTRLIVELRARIERELRARDLAPASLELRSCSNYPHRSNPFTSKFQRGAR